ncbi:hypothetical protein ACV1CZ_22355, partial [Aeromonas caviae]
IDWIGHTEYSETRIEQLDHIFNLIGISLANAQNPVYYIDKHCYSASITAFQTAQSLFLTRLSVKYLRLKRYSLP